jgi:hypothetical protein
MKRLFAAAAVLALCSHAAFAGELTLFADSDFRGARVTVQRDEPDLNRAGMNDRASSMVVRSGVWLVCEHRDFGGYCAEFGPGEYRGLPRFNDSISSVREVTRGGPGRDRGDDRDGGWRGDRGDGGWRGDRNDRDERRGGDWRGDDRGGGDVILFTDANFGGPEVALSGNMRSLNDVGFNDRASSMIIRDGRWELCQDSDFRGQCMVYGPGRYPGLDRMNDRISSIRRVR